MERWANLCILCKAGRECGRLHVRAAGQRAAPKHVDAQVLYVVPRECLRQAHHDAVSSSPCKGLSQPG